MCNALSSNKFWVGAWQIENHKGQQFWLRAVVAPVLDKHNKLDHFEVFANNLTRTIDASQQYESMINAIQRSTAMIEFDIDGHVLFANDLFLAAMGYRLEDIKGKHHRMFCPPDIAGSKEYQQFWQKLGQGLRDPHEFTPRVQCYNSLYPASVYSGARYCATVLL